MVRLVVGVHARRGDKLRVWRQQTYIRDILSRYEGRFLRHAMEVRAVNDIPRNFHNIWRSHLQSKEASFWFKSTTNF